MVIRGVQDIHSIEAELQGIAARSLGRWTLIDLQAALLGGRKQAYEAVEDGERFAVMLTRVHPEGVYIEAATGRERHRWAAEFDAAMEAWARALGVPRVFAMVRPGWAREAKALGWREVHREFVKEVA